MIKNLTLRNFKGVTGQFGFSAGNYVTGGNFQGKTAIHQGACAALLGYVPGYDKTTASVKAFASDFPMEIILQAVVGGEEATGHLSFGKPKGKVTLEKSEVMISKLDGAAKVLFDPSLFFSLSDSARIAKAIELVAGRDIDRDKIIESVVAAVGAEKELQDRLARWRLTMKNAATINDVIASSDTFWKEARKDFKAEKDRMQKTGEGLADLNQLQQAMASYKSRQELTSEKAKKQKDLRERQDAVASAEATNRTIVRTAESVKGLQAQAATAQNIASHIDEAKATIENLSNLHIAAKTQHEQALAELNEHEENKPLPLVAREVQLDQVDPGTVVTIVATATKTENGLELKEVLSATFEPDPEEIEDYEARLSQHAARAAELNEAVNQVNDGLKKTRDDLVEAQENLKKLEAQLAAAKAAADSLQSITQAQTPVSNEQIEAWRGEARTIQDEIHLIEKNLDELTNLEHDSKRVKEAADRRQNMDAIIDKIETVLSLIAEKRQGIVSLSIEAPLAIANRLAKNILRGALVFQEGELGMLIGTTFVSSHTFSGTEAAMVVMGLTAGLSNKSKIRTLILDEVGRLDQPNAKQLILNLDELVKSGDIDQWVILGPKNEQLIEFCQTQVGATIITP
ncbi:MAG: hypothetical protein SFV32_12520 [Opitutaceae bacterium]|nr:hypothetical protein [Opitutaceae bacterium]